jgi:hypothetical protein
MGIKCTAPPGEWLSHPGHFNPGKNPSTHRIEDWVGPKAHVAIFGKENNFLALLRFEPQTIQPIVYSLWL